eukprot:278498-Pyramimonas_sp.AAC.1
MKQVAQRFKDEEIAHYASLEEMDDMPWTTTGRSTSSTTWGTLSPTLCVRERFVNVQAACHLRSSEPYRCDPHATL